MRALAAVDTDALLELAWAAPLAVFVVTVSWALVIWGATRATDLRRDGHVALAGMHVLIAVAGSIVFVAAVASGIIVMTTK